MKDANVAEVLFKSQKRDSDFCHYCKTIGTAEHLLLRLERSEMPIGRTFFAKYVKTFIASEEPQARGELM